MSDKKENMVEMILSNVEDEVVEIARYQVKFTGYGGQNVQRGKKTNREYTFVRGDWVDVAEMDWHHYKKKVEKTVDAGKDPHWDVRTVDVFDKVKEYFVDKVAKIRGKKIKSLDEVPGLNETRLRVLKQNEIRSINQFLGIPASWMLNNKDLNFRRNEYYEILDKIRSSYL